MTHFFPTRRSSPLTGLYTLFHALVRYASPVLVFTAEEVWGTRYPDADSVHLLEWPTLPTHHRHPREGGDPEPAPTDPTLGSRVRWNDELMKRWKRMRSIRLVVNEAIEPLRSQTNNRSILAAECDLSLQDQASEGLERIK